MQPAGRLWSAGEGDVERVLGEGLGEPAFLLGGEGLVCNFSGKGKLWIQTRNPQAFGQLIGSKLPPRSS